MTIKMKYLKRILHAPQGTPNVAVLIELGVKPITQEIHTRQLNFLHHILTMEKNDPVRKIYDQQKKFQFEKTWYNEVKNLLKMYSLEYDEGAISELKKETWKRIVKKQVCTYTMNQFNNECKEKKKTRSVPCQNKIRCKEYMLRMTPQEARMFFKVRVNIVDLRAVRDYMYDEKVCRLCGQEKEDVNHVLNECEEVTRTSRISDEDIHKEKDVETKKEVVRRVIEFQNKVKEKERKVSESPD